MTEIGPMYNRLKISFVFSQHRSGSKLLCDLLDSHPDIACPHESLNPGRGKPLSLDDVDALIKNIAHSNPEATHICLHGHYEYLYQDILMFGAPKILLYRWDEVRGGVSQSLMGIRRANRKFDLDLGVARKNIALRRERNAALGTYSTFNLPYELLTWFGRDIRKMPLWLNWWLLRHIGAGYERLTTTVKREPEMLPRNLREIYQDGRA